MKQEKTYIGDGGTGVKPEHFLQRRMRYTYGCDKIQKMCDIDRKIAINNLGR